ncbi:PIN domain-containing protein [Sulfitobacter sp. 1A15333]|uniref:PIN domain-containing protein n=1 Tax=Sulfitobacter sp. 1A15333 TaxID=3368570 RepID=UPI003745206C
MNHIANPFVAVLDACVLYPYRMRDVLLEFATQGIFRARFTEEIMDEWSRNVIKDMPDTVESVKAQLGIIGKVFEECFVTGYKPLIAGLELPDPDDRHVLAAGIKSSTQVIVTKNHKDFPEDVLEEFDIITVDPDEFLADAFELFPMEATGALRTLRARLTRPPMDVSEFLLDLTRAGVPRLAAKAREHIEFL